MLVAVPRVSRSCEHFPDGFDLHLLQLQENVNLRRRARTALSTKVLIDFKFGGQVLQLGVQGSESDKSDLLYRVFPRRVRNCQPNDTVNCTHDTLNLATLLT